MPRYLPTNWYETPLYYDIVFDADTRSEADFLEAAMARYGRAGGRAVLEPACGSGRLVSEMARRGYRVSGLDLCGPALDFARRRLRGEGLRATLVCGAMERFTLESGPFRLAHCLVSSFKYLLTEDAARSHLRCVARALAPGGLYVLGLHLCDYGNFACEHERWVARRAGVEVRCNIRAWPADPRRRLQRMRSRLLVRTRGTEKRYETEWHFRTYGPRQLRRLIASVPALELVATHDFDCDIGRPIDLEGPRLDVVLVLRRR